MSLCNPNPVDAAKPKRVAIVIASPAVSTTTGRPVGFWWSELSGPWFAFTEKGCEVEVFPPQGGRCEACARATRATPRATSRRT
jgi:putative intracellular protease/amidase